MGGVCGLTADEEGAGAGWEVEGDVCEACGAVWEGEGEVAHGDGWGGGHGGGRRLLCFRVLEVQWSSMCMLRI